MQNRRCPTGDFAPQNLPRGPALKRGQATTNEPVARVFYVLKRYEDGLARF